MYSLGKKDLRIISKSYKTHLIIKDLLYLIINTFWPMRCDGTSRADHVGGSGHLFLYI
jgi:transposase